MKEVVIASNGRTVTRTDFQDKHMPLIIKGSRIELDGWCDAYNEAIKMIDSGKITGFEQYAKISACELYSMNTIKTYLNHVSWAVNKSGIDMDEWNSIEEIKNTRYPKAVKAKAKAKGMVKQYDSVLSQAKALPKADRKALALALLAMD